MEWWRYASRYNTAFKEIACDVPNFWFTTYKLEHNKCEHVNEFISESVMILIALGELWELFQCIDIRMVKWWFEIK